MSAFQTFCPSPSAATPAAPEFSADRRGGHGSTVPPLAFYRKGNRLLTAKTATAHFSRRASRIRNCGIKGHTRIDLFQSLPSCASRKGRRRRPFQLCIERVQDVRRLFLQLGQLAILAARQPESHGQAGVPVPDLVGSRLPSPYHFRAQIQSFQDVAAPIPGDSILPPLAPRSR
jgi:hypothetical protein